MSLCNNAGEACVSVLTGGFCSPAQPRSSIDKSTEGLLVSCDGLACYKEKRFPHNPSMRVLLLINCCKRKQHNRRRIWSHMESRLSSKDSVLSCAFVETTQERQL